jgi:hypothetical protein
MFHLRPDAGLGLLSFSRIAPIVVLLSSTRRLPGIIATCQFTSGCLP